MDFDHVRGEKVAEITKIINHISSRKDLLLLKEEIAKCEVVCSNCHRLRTISRLGDVVEKRILEKNSQRLTKLLYSAEKIWGKDCEILRKMHPALPPFKGRYE
jgi:hypothetical protein